MASKPWSRRSLIHRTTISDWDLRSGKPPPFTLLLTSFHRSTSPCRNGSKSQLEKQSSITAAVDWTAVAPPCTASPWNAPPRLSTRRHRQFEAHLAPNSHASFDIQEYISRILYEDFKVVVGISPIIWLLAVLFFLSSAHGSYSYHWLPFIPLLITLIVGAKLEMIITKKMGLRIQDRGDVIKGTPIVKPGDDLFWFNRPQLLLFLIHFVLFQNAFQLAFFAWSWYEYGIPSYFHRRPQDIAIRLSMGIMVQFLCSYVTPPMGTTMKPAIFNKTVTLALKSWHNTAKRHIKESPTPMSSSSPIHLLQSYQNSNFEDSLQTSPRTLYNDDEDEDPSRRSLQEISINYVDLSFRDNSTVA